MAKRRSIKAELTAALHEKACEADAWRACFHNREAYYVLDVMIPQKDAPDAFEYWYLHAPHRPDGGVLRIDDGSYERVWLLAAIPQRVRESINACPYRRNALARIESASAAYLRKLHRYGELMDAGETGSPEARELTADLHTPKEG